MFPHGFLKCFLTSQNVSCFLPAVSCRENRKLSSKAIVSIERNRFPSLKTFPRQETLRFLESFLGRRSARWT
jgi:hypothetical protein